jgi:transcriptional regulator with XRE-family HTH domain
MFRLRAGKTQEELAREAKLGRNIIASIEIGARQTMLIDSAAALARALGVSLDQLYGFDLLEEEENEGEYVAATVA